ncbi:hypothetical protein ACFLQU_05970, partial [Verrucomicrobiota bacterium]
LDRSAEVARPLSAVMIVICSLIVVWSIFGLLFGGADAVDVPKFKSIEKRFEVVGTDARTMSPEDFVKSQEKKELEEKYTGKIEKLIKKRGLTGGDKVVIIKRLIQLEPEHRGLFLKGLDGFLASAAKFNKKMEKEERAGIDIPDAANRYTEMFKKSAANAEKSQARAAEQRATKVRTLTNCIGLLMFFLIVPLLIQIAENTAKS